jgi:hypothetical protein
MVEPSVVSPGRLHSPLEQWKVMRKCDRWEAAFCVSHPSVRCKIDRRARLSAANDVGISAACG